MSDSPNVVKLINVAADTEQQDRENVNAFLEYCKEQDFNALILLGITGLAGKIFGRKQSNVSEILLLFMAGFSVFRWITNMAPIGQR